MFEPRACENEETEIFFFSNAIGAYGGSYSVYRSLAVAMGDLPADVSIVYHWVLFRNGLT